ncbi:MAG: hypothetical protein ACRDJP_16830 [Actinomycetota bacterium]
MAKVRARRFGAPCVGAAAGLVVGLVASAVMVGVGALDEPEPEPFETDPAAVAEFLEAWERSRTGTFVVVSRFTRSVAGRSGISSTTTLVQEPPTRIASQLGSITGRVGDREISCTTGPDGELQCLPGRTLPAYAEETEDELALLRRYVAAPGRDLYFVDRRTVDGRPGCFRLRLAYEIPTPPLGETAVYCFDPATGAPTRTEIAREQGRDLTEAVEIRTEVTADDLELPR